MRLNRSVKPSTRFGVELEALSASFDLRCGAGIELDHCMAGKRLRIWFRGQVKGLTFSYGHRHHANRRETQLRGVVIPCLKSSDLITVIDGQATLVFGRGLEDLRRDTPLLDPRRIDLPV